MNSDDIFPASIFKIENEETIYWNIHWYTNYIKAVSDKDYQWKAWIENSIPGVADYLLQNLQELTEECFTYFVYHDAALLGFSPTLVKGLQDLRERLDALPYNIKTDDREVLKSSEWNQITVLAFKVYSLWKEDAAAKKFIIPSVPVDFALQINPRVDVADIGTHPSSIFRLRSEDRVVAISSYINDFQYIAKNEIKPLSWFERNILNKKPRTLQIRSTLVSEPFTYFIYHDAKKIGFNDQLISALKNLFRKFAKLPYNSTIAEKNIIQTSDWTEVVIACRQVLELWQADATANKYFTQTSDTSNATSR